MANFKIPTNAMLGRDGKPLTITASRELTPSEGFIKCAGRNGLAGSEAVLVGKEVKNSWLGGEKSIFTYVCTEEQS